MNLESFDEIFKEFYSETNPRQFFGVLSFKNDQIPFEKWFFGVPVSPKGNSIFEKYFLGLFERLKKGELNMETLKDVQRSVFAEQMAEKNERVKSCCELGNVWESPEIFVNNRVRHLCNSWSKQCKAVGSWSTFCVDGEEGKEYVVYFSENGGKLIGDNPKNSRFRATLSWVRNGWNEQMVDEGWKEFKCIPN